jgi:very-short-patch-repair endonuclease
MPFKRDHDRRLLGFAKDMRAGPTDAKQKLWRLLRGRRLGGFKFRRQVPVAGYILDYYCLKSNLVVELDGGQHNDPAVKEYDERRTHRLAELGIRVLRFPDDEGLRYADAVCEAIYRELTSKTPSP